MSTGTNTPRILAAAKEFNIGKETLVEFLKGKGYEVDASKPTSKLSEEMYDALQTEFAKDKATKRKSESMTLPKGALLESLNKSQEQLDLTAKASKTEEKPKATKVEKPAAKPVEEKVTPAVPAVEPPAPKEEKEPEIKPEPIVEVKKEIPQPEVIAPVAPPQPEVKVVEEPKVATPAAEPTKVEPVTETPKVEEKQHIDTHSPRLEGPKVQGKINLDDLNLSTRPKKGTTKKKEEPVKVEVKPVANKAETPKPKTEEKVEKVVPKEVPTAPKPVAEVPSTPAPVKVVAPTNTNIPAEPEVPEHIEMKAPKLEGPKIIGKIELPVNTVGGKQERKDKRKRKRIPLEGKKPESGAPNTGTGGHNNANRNNTGSGPNTGNNRGNNNNRPGGNTGGGPRRDFNNNRSGPAGNNANRGDRRGRPTPVVEQEIDAKAIQDKIKETQAKLSGGGSRNKNLKAKYRRNKREEMAEKRAAAEMNNDGSVIQVTEFISVSELANLLDVGFAEIISKCMSLGIMVSINQRLDAEVIELVASEFDKEVKFNSLSLMKKKIQ
jgi:translation initiation factor IF-2